VLAHATLFHFDKHLFFADPEENEFIVVLLVIRPQVDADG
jgi:hypothetical protein